MNLQNYIKAFYSYLCVAVVSLAISSAVLAMQEENLLSKTFSKTLSTSDCLNLEEVIGQGLEFFPNKKDEKEYPSFDKSSFLSQLTPVISNSSQGSESFSILKPCENINSKSLLFLEHLKTTNQNLSEHTLEISSNYSINNEKNEEKGIQNRKIIYRTLSLKLKSLNDEQLLEILEKAEPLYSGVGGASVSLKLDGISVFAKKIRLTDIEMLSENRKSTANLFELPLYYQYGIGSAGFGAWRELAAHTMTTDWVLKDECPNFPLLYDWRVLPDFKRKKSPGFKENYNIRLIHKPLTSDPLNLIKQGELGLFYENDELYCKSSDKEKMQIFKTEGISTQGINSKTFDRLIKALKKCEKQQNFTNVGVITEEDKEELLRFTTSCGYTPSKLDRIVEHWGGSSAIRARIEMIENASTNLVLFLEYIPETLEQWLERTFFKEGLIDESALLMVEKELKAIASFIKKHNFLHFDAHFKNILTDGYRLYLADFGLTTSPTFKLSNAEDKFVEAHREYDQYYMTGLWASWIGKIFFGKENFKSKLYEYAIGKGEKLSSPLATTILNRDAQIFIMMDAFFKDLRNEIKAKKMLNSEPAFKNFVLFKSIHGKNKEDLNEKY